MFKDGTKTSMCSLVKFVGTGMFFVSIELNKDGLFNNPDLIRAIK